MIGFILDFLRRTAGQVDPSNLDNAAWKLEFEQFLKKSDIEPRGLVDFVRHGIPNSLRGWAWKKILRTSQVPTYLRDFDRELLRIFGTLDPTRFQPPCFGNPLDFSRINLSAAKKETIKKLLCIIGDLHPQLEYSPTIPAITAILCKFLEPNDVLACLTSMIEGHSIPASKRQDWAYFPLHRRDYLVFERVFEDLVNNFAPKVAKHLAKMQLIYPDYAPPWQKILFGLFIGILPREVVVRIFDSYLVEGYKIILRYSIAHIIIRQDCIINSKTPNEIDEVIIHSPDSGQDLINLYFRTAMRVKFDRSIIQRYRNRRRKHSLGDFDMGDRNLIFQRPLPVLKKPSSFMQDRDWANIWSWIPPRFRLLDLELVFTTTEHGRHLSTLLLQSNANEPLLLLIETKSGKIFGAYISKALNTSQLPRFYGTGETFLFSIKPEAAKYEWDIKSENNSFVYVSDGFIALGTGDDFGLHIDKFLKEVSSGISVTFKNVPFVNNLDPEDKEIYCLEVFRFI